MDRKKFTYCQAAIGAFIGALVGWSIATRNMTLPMLAITVGLILDRLCRGRVTEVVEDEMILRISEKASRRALQVFVAASGVVGVVLTTLRGGEYARLAQAGYTLAFSACALLMLYLVFYGYYNRKGVA
ncbi:DUF2178 domain-containing protein [Candidatus Bathyarchaeota archaeon]|nr:DUF2178 domain-containing protein [Candidatus Bathyarchaeota archaeon]